MPGAHRSAVSSHSGQGAYLTVRNLTPSYGGAGTVITVRFKYDAAGRPAQCRLVLHNQPLPSQPSRTRKSLIDWKIQATIPSMENGIYPLRLEALVDDEVVASTLCGSFEYSNSQDESTYKPRAFSGQRRAKKSSVSSKSSKKSKRNSKLPQPCNPLPSCNPPAYPDGEYLDGKPIVLVDPSYIIYTLDWSPEERKVGRRLMQFSFEICDNVLHISCHTAPHHQYPDDTQNIISMINYRGTMLFTSVDFIRLLEWISCCTYSQEERCRVRRRIPQNVYKQYEDNSINDQGTVLKTADANSFYNRITEYNNPRPVNIKKPVKVFTWSRLTSMLLKAFDEYAFYRQYVTNTIFIRPRVDNRGKASWGYQEDGRKGTNNRPSKSTKSDMKAPRARSSRRGRPYPPPGFDLGAQNDSMICQSTSQSVEVQAHLDDIHQDLVDSEPYPGTRTLETPSSTESDRPLESLLHSPLASQSASLRFTSPLSTYELMYSLPGSWESSSSYSPMELIPTYDESLLTAPPEYCMPYNQSSSFDSFMASPPPPHEPNWTWPTPMLLDTEAPSQLFNPGLSTPYDFKASSQCLGDYDSYANVNGSTTVSMVPEGYEHYAWDSYLYTDPTPASGQYHQ